jgi:hypothetical protein
MTTVQKAWIVPSERSGLAGIDPARFCRSLKAHRADTLQELRKLAETDGLACLGETLGHRAYNPGNQMIQGLLVQDLMDIFSVDGISMETVIDYFTAGLVAINQSQEEIVSFLHDGNEMVADRDVLLHSLSQIMGSFEELDRLPEFLGAIVNRIMLDRVILESATTSNTAAASLPGEVLLLNEALEIMFRDLKIKSVAQLMPANATSDEVETLTRILALVQALSSSPAIEEAFFEPLDEAASVAAQETIDDVLNEATKWVGTKPLKTTAATPIETQPVPEKEPEMPATPTTGAATEMDEWEE